MIKINQRYLGTEEIRDNSATRSKVFATQLVDSGMLEQTNLELLDIYNDSQNCGFEVVICEAPMINKLIIKMKILQ